MQYLLILGAKITSKTIFCFRIEVLWHFCGKRTAGRRTTDATVPSRNTCQTTVYGHKISSLLVEKATTLIAAECVCHCPVVCPACTLDRQPYLQMDLIIVISCTIRSLFYVLVILLESGCLELVISWFIRFPILGLNSKFYQTQFLESIFAVVMKSKTQCPYLIATTDRIQASERASLTTVSSFGFPWRKMS